MLDNIQRYRSMQQPRAIDPFDGVLLVNKPAGPTSHDIVDSIRKNFKFKKVGHGGTLDPQATGLLVILVGRGTKLSDQFLQSDKIYTGTICLGKSTSSYDAQGETVKEADASGVTKEQIEEEMKKLVGDIMQTPPMVSAVKVNGVPLYKHARKGKTVERKARMIHVYEFSMTSCDIPRAEFLVRCTKGTYVRSLCHEIGESLGCGAHLETLHRTQSGENKVDDALTLDEILKMSKDELMDKIIPAAKFARKAPR